MPLTDFASLEELPDNALLSFEEEELVTKKQEEPDELMEFGAIDMMDEYAMY
jgi:hypothetical protein